MWREEEGVKDHHIYEKRKSEKVKKEEQEDGVTRSKKEKDWEGGDERMIVDKSFKSQAAALHHEKRLKTVIYDHPSFFKLFFSW